MVRLTTSCAVSRPLEPAFTTLFSMQSLDTSSESGVHIIYTLPRLIRHTTHSRSAQIWYRRGACLCSTG